jgi:hypothetical protein
VQHPPRSERELRAQLDAFREAGTLKSDERVAEAVRFIRNPPLRKSMLPAYRVLFAGAVASIPRDYRVMLGLKRSPLPVVFATRLVLRFVGAVLGSESTSEVAARERIARLDAGDALRQAQRP